MSSREHCRDEDQMDICDNDCFPLPQQSALRCCWLQLCSCTSQRSNRIPPSDYAFDSGLHWKIDSLKYWRMELEKRVILTDYSDNALASCRLSWGLASFCVAHKRCVCLPWLLLSHRDGAAHASENVPRLPTGKRITVSSELNRESLACSTLCRCFLICFNHKNRYSLDRCDREFIDSNCVIWSGRNWSKSGTRNPLCRKSSTCNINVAEELIEKQRNVVCYEITPRLWWVPIAAPALYRSFPSENTASSLTRYFRIYISADLYSN